MNEEEDIEQLKRSLGLKQKKPYAQTSVDAVCEILSAANYLRGIATTMMLIIRANGNPAAENILMEIDAVENKITKAMYALYR